MPVNALRTFAQSLEQYRYAPTRFCRDLLDMEPHPGQVRWLRNSTSLENALVCGNRWGKSHVAAAKIIWKCAFRKGWSLEMREQLDRSHTAYHAINICISADQSKLVWHKANALLAGPKASWMVRSVKMTPFPRIEFVNGAVFEARSSGNNGERLLGNSYDHINWDEAAYEKRFTLVRNNVLRMRVVDRAGTIDYTSTGNGRNDFGEYFLTGLPGEKKDPDLYSQTGPTTENPNIPHWFVEKNAARMSDRMRRQNIGGEIVDAGGGFFDIADLEAALDDDLTASMVIHARDAEDHIEHAEVYRNESESGVAVPGGLPWHNRFPAHRYVHFWDLADKADWVVGWTLDTSGDQLVAVEFERFQKRGWSYNYDRIRARHHKYAVGSVDGGASGQSRTIVDGTGIGDVAVSDLGDINAEGFIFTKASKDQILGDLQAALSLRGLRWPMIPVAYDEHKFYEREDKDLTQDTVMALAGAVHFGRRREYVFEGY